MYYKEVEYFVFSAIQAAWLARAPLMKAIGLYVLYLFDKIFKINFLLVFSKSDINSI